MRVAVGSGNPVKRAATERVLGGDVEAHDVDSGVSEQPTGHGETRRGARTRARRAFEAGAYDVGVGIEGGVARFPDEDDDSAEAAVAVGDGTPLYLVMWAAVTDGERVGTGAGPSLALPEAIARRVRDGEELGPVMDDVLGTDDVAKKQGAAGAFTGGRLTRTDALTTAVTAAAGPWLCDLY